MQIIKPNIQQVQSEVPFSQIDLIVSAEVPGVQENPVLRDRVLRYNQHPQFHLSSPTIDATRMGPVFGGFRNQYEE